MYLQTLVSQYRVTKNSVLFLAIVLVAGTISTMIPTTTFAQPQYNEQKYKGYEDSYGKDYYEKSSGQNIQKVKCNNVNNIIINGADNTGQGTTAGGMLGEMVEDDGTWEKDEWLSDGEQQLDDINKNIVNICINNNNIAPAEAAEEQNGLNDGSLYIVVGPMSISDGTLITESIASCHAGDFVISGGFNLVPTEVDLVDLESIKSIPTSSLDGWSASFQPNQEILLSFIQATAVCFDDQ
jgi:hypothetical protein